jgi:hypothetical protein
MKSLVKKWFFSENSSIHDRALVPPILTFLLALIAGLLGAEKLSQALKNNVQTYLNGCEFTDDFTLVVLEVQSTS